MKAEIVWHRFSFPDSIPPLNTGILITDGYVVTVAELYIFWQDKSIKALDDYSLSGHGFEGYEWDYNFKIEDVKYWTLLPDIPGKKKIRV